MAKEQNLDPARMLARYRRMMLAIGLLYPAWRFLAYYAHPQSYEPWAMRGMIGVFFLTFTLLTYWSKYFQKHVDEYFTIVTYVWLVQIFYLLYVNNMQFEYLLAALVVIFAAGSSFVSSRSMLYFYLLSLIFTGAVLLAKPMAYGLTFFFGVVTALVVSYIALTNLLSMFKELRENQKALELRTREFTELSSAVQSLFLPAESEHSHSKWSLSGFYRPVDGCGGDWWSYDERDGRISVIVGDITGHGPGPAMMTASIASYMRALQNERPDLTWADLLSALNRHLIELQTTKNSKHNYLMTVHALEIDLIHGVVQSWSAGAPSAAIINSQGEVRFVGQSGSPLGAHSSLSLGLDRTEIGPGDRIFLYTDGIMEAKNKVGAKTIGERKIIKFAIEDRTLSLVAAKEKLIARIDQFAEGRAQEDDYTFVLLDVA